MENKRFEQQDVDNNKIFGILAYIGILFLVPLLAAKDSAYARFHANQGIVLFIAEAVVGIAAGIVTAILSIAIPIVGVILGSLITGVVSLVSLVFMILGIVNACSGEEKKLPLIGNIQILK